jgi:hypothetical protein
MILINYGAPPGLLASQYLPLIQVLKIIPEE